MKLCPECRTENADTARFCVQCGQPLPDQVSDQPDAAFPEEEVKAGNIKPHISASSMTPATSTTDGKPIVVPSVEEQVPPHAVDAALNTRVVEEEPTEPPLDEVL